MKNIFLTAGIVSFLLFTSSIAQANFYVEGNGATKPAARCQSTITRGNAACPPAARCAPMPAAAWESPTLEKIKCNSFPTRRIETDAPPAACPKPAEEKASCFFPPAKPMCQRTPSPACQTCPPPACPINCPPPPCIGPCAPKNRVISVVMYEGSLKNNLERILRENGWEKVIWKAQHDYRWVGTARIAGPSLLSVVSTITDPFPLEVTFYEANHVVAISNRTFHE